MKEHYEAPEIELVIFSSKDVILTSGYDIDAAEENDEGYQNHQ